MDKKRKESNGHTLIFFKPDWPTLPVRSDAKKARSSPRRGRACTCTACYRTAFRGNLPKGQCRGTADAIFQGTKNVWDRVQSSPVTLQRLLACWGMSKQEAEQKLFNGTTLKKGKSQVVSSGQKTRDEVIDTKISGHSIVRFQPYWETIPRTQNEIPCRNTRGFTCARCWRFALTGDFVARLGTNKCDKHFSPSTPTLKAWQRDLQSPQTLSTVLNLGIFPSRRQKANLVIILSPLSPLNGLVQPRHNLLFLLHAHCL